MDSLTLTDSALRGLVGSGRLAVARGSPLEPWRVAGNGAEGVALPEQSEVPTDFGDALGVLAAPEASATLTVATPGKARSAFRIAVRGGRSVLFAPEGDGLSIVRPESLEDLARRLSAESLHRGPLAGRHVMVWASILQLVTYLWLESKDPDRVLERAEAEGRLVQAGSGELKADAAVGHLILNGTLEKVKDTVSVSPHLRPWLKAFWSGHALRVDYREADGAEGSDAPHPHLLFVGLSGERVRAQELSGDTLREQLAGKPAREEKALLLSAPPADGVLHAFRELFRLPARA